MKKTNISAALSGLLMLLMLAAMLFWFFEPDTLLLWFNQRESAPIRFNVALVSFLIGWAIFLLNADPADEKAKRRLLVIISAILIILGMVLSQYIFSIDLGIDELIIKHNEKTHGRFSGRIPLLPLLNLIAVTLILLLISRKKIIAPILLMTVILLPSFFLLGEAITGASLFPPMLQSWKVSYSAGAIFLLMLAAIFMSRPIDELRKSIYVKLTGFSLIAILALIVVFNAFLQNHLLQEKSQQKIRADYQVIDKLQLCNNAFVDLENDWRDFYLFNDKNYLSAYQQQTRILQNCINDLKIVAADDQELWSTADTLMKLLSLHQKGNTDLFERLEKKDRFEVFSEKNQYINQAISLTSKVIIKKVAQERVRFLSQQKISDQYLRIFILFSGIAIFILLIGLRLIVSNLKKRTEAEYKLKMLNDEQEKQIARVTEEIKQTEQRFQMLIQNMQEGVQIIGFDWKYKYLNDAVIRHSKAKAEDLLGFTMMEKYPGIENTEVFKEMQRCMTERISSSIENQFVYPDGSKNWFNLSIEPVPEGLFLMSTDIDERKKSEKTLNDYKMALDASAIISITDANGLITYVNQKFCDTSGYTEQQLIGKTHRTVNSGTHDRYFWRQFWNTVQSGQVWRGEVCNLNKDGSLIWLDTVVIPFVDDDNKPYQYMAIRNDISSRKKIELENEKIRKDLQRRARELQRSNAELEQYAYAASHDLQEPARTVSNFMTLLQKKYASQLDDTAKTYIQFAVDGALRMRALILDLLEIARIGHEEKEKETVDLNETIKRSVTELQEKIQLQNAQVNWSPMPSVLGHANLLQQVFTNLISNAIKFKGKADPVINISVEDKTQEWQFCVEDNGIGIEKDFYDKIFVIFQRLNKQENYAGTGIGLAVVKKIIEQLHGKIWVESEPGVGSRFYFTLPKR